MTLLFMTFAKWTHATQPWKTGSLLRFFSHLAVFGALWEGCELWGCTFVKVHSPVRESEPSKVIARRCLGRKQTLLLLFFIFLQTCTHIKMCTATDFLKSPKCFFFFLIYLSFIYICYSEGLCARASFVCLMSPIFYFHPSRMNSIWQMKENHPSLMFYCWHVDHRLSASIPF